MDLNNLLYRRVYTGKPGRPKNSGAHDFEAMYEICKRMAANPDLSRADAIRQVVDTEKDYNAVDRLTRKLRLSPRMLENAKAYRAKAIDRFVRSSRGTQSELQIIGFRSRQAVADYLLMKSLAPPEIWQDPEVLSAIAKVWRTVRPSIALEAMWEVQDMMARLEPYESVRKIMDEQRRLDRLLHH